MKLGKLIILIINVHFVIKIIQKRVLFHTFGEVIQKLEKITKQLDQKVKFRGITV